MLSTHWVQIADLSIDGLTDDILSARAVISVLLDSDAAPEIDYSNHVKWYAPVPCFTPDLCVCSRSTSCKWHIIYLLALSLRSLRLPVVAVLHLAHLEVAHHLQACLVLNE